MKITLNWLQEHGACAEGIAWFRENYPDGGEAEEIAHRHCGKHIDWADWLAAEARLTVVLCGTRPDGTRIEEYWQDGKWHRVGGPAAIVIYANGTRSEGYWQDGKLHRVGGPAVVWTSANGTRGEGYWQDGKRHRVDGPAVIWTYPDGTRYEEYWQDGKRVKGAKT